MEIKTNRLIIKDYKLENLSEIHKLTTEPEIYKYMNWGPNSVEDTESFIKMTILQQEEDPRSAYEMILRDRKTDEAIGSVGIRITQKASKIAEFGYWIKKDLWGQGFATEAAKEMIKLGFETMGLNKVAATAWPENIASLRVMEKLGMKKEGILRDHIYARGEFHDSVYMSILRSEYNLI